MVKWSFWRDEYSQTTQGNWRETNWPESKDVELQYEEVERELLSYFIPRVRHLVQITGDKVSVQALISLCSICNEPTAWCACQGNTYELGYHATRMEANNVKR